ncbi:MAG TPA: hypothetical protein VNA69_21010 [Thermoanaerobaculia bacterium]|nr:hypothetical protein [Thermoanaerobaculia bacterium]
MAIILPGGLTASEIRVLQEFRRLNADALTLEQIKAIKHPAGAGGEAPAVTLVGKGFLEADGSSEGFSLTQKAKDFLAIEAVPLVEETSEMAASAAAEPGADGV